MFAASQPQLYLSFANVKFNFNFELRLRWEKHWAGLIFASHDPRMPRLTSLLPSRVLLSAFPRDVTRKAASAPLRRALTSASSTRSSGRPALQPRSCLSPPPCSTPFSDTWTWKATRSYKTPAEAKSQHRRGPFSFLAGVLFLSSGAGLIIYFRYEKERMERKRVAEATKGVGKPKVGGKFELLDQRGEAWGSERMKGRYSLVYFGFSHCPDICPEELDKMAQMIDLVNASPLLSSRSSSLPPLLPVFITCDPARDTPAVLATYLAEFHPAIVGLTGTWEQIKDVCKKYRVYFSTPSGVTKGQDYLVDHSIYFYLMDPEGDFVEAIGRQHSPKEAADIILAHVGDWVRG
ncbi:sco1 protein [Diplocarpon mali]|nr:sco1 protein [Diplocarpon mali]